jgi:hypothetical protein
MTIDRNPHLVIPVKTYTNYSVCEPWCIENVGEWNIDWWKDFPDIAMSVVLGDVPQPDTYWFHNEKHALAFTLKFR